MEYFKYLKQTFLEMSYNVQCFMAFTHAKNEKNGRQWVGLEIRVPGLASHPRAHTRAKYDLVLANYAMSRSFSTSFPLKSIELRT
jgi:hypothetical protein